MQKQCTAKYPLMACLMLVTAASDAWSQGSPRAAYKAATRAEGGQDGYCDYVLGVASAESALMFAPLVYASVGDIDQTEVVNGTSTQVRDLRTTFGVRWRLDGLFEGVLTRQRADADCRRHRALVKISESSNHQAMAARIAVYEQAMQEADALLKRALEDLADHRASLQDATATRLRVNELREALAKAKAELASLPAPIAGEVTAGALAEYVAQDARMEEKAGSLRRMRAFDLSLRFGYDELANRETSSPYFFLASASFNLGGLFQGSGNDRAAEGRKRMLHQSQGVLADMSVHKLTQTLEIESKRLEEVAVLALDLEKQLAQLKAIGGDATRRFRDIVWFEWVQAKAEHAYLRSHVSTLRTIVGAP